MNYRHFAPLPHVATRVLIKKFVLGKKKCALCQLTLCPGAERVGILLTWEFKGLVFKSGEWSIWCYFAVLRSTNLRTDKSDNKLWVLF